MHKKILESITVLLIIVNIVLLGTIMIKSFSTDNQKIKLETEVNTEENYIKLTWNVDGSSADYDDGEYIGTTNEYAYKVYSSTEGKEYETVGTVDYEAGEKIKVLNVYPNAGNVLKTWMETNGYGKGLIQVDPISISEFNNNPTNYLGTSGNWKYDVIAFGTWDCNNACDLSASARDLTAEFIESGRGAVFGHDTIALVNNDSRLNHPNFVALAKYVNIENRGYWTNNGTTDVYLVKDGIFTSFPWNIGTIGTHLTIPQAHNLDQNAKGNIWIKFNNNTLSGNQNFYLTTWNNCAMIQTGHSNAQATPDEQKIWANILFYVKQITTQNTVKDYAGMDLNAPNKVENVETEFDNDGNLCINFEQSEDNGSIYKYYIEGTHQETKNKIISNEQQVEIKSGTKGYIYTIDDKETINKDDIPIDTLVGENKIVVPMIDITKGKYLHIAAIDNADNISEVSTIKLKYEYKMNIEIEDNQDTEKKIKDIKLKIIAKNENGEIEKQEEVTTNEKGNMELKNEIQLNKELTYTIIPEEIPGPYKDDKGKEIKVTIDENGNLTVEDLEEETEVENVSKTINTKLVLENKMIQVEIEKEDKDGENIKLANVGLEIEGTKVITDKEGCAQTEVFAKEEGTYEYTIKETEEPKGYKSIDESKLNVTYDSKGNVIDANSSNENIIVEKYENEKISLKIKNNKKTLEGYKLKVEGIDIDNRDQKVSGAKYRIEIEADSGEKLTSEQKTDDNGNIEIQNLNTIGETRVKISQIEAATDYIKNEEITYLTFNRTEDGNITVDSTRTNAEIEGSITDNKEIKIVMLNTKKTNENRINIEVTEEPNITIENLKFTIEDEYGISKKEQMTNEDGKIVFEDIQSLGIGDYIYKITPEENNIYGIGEIRVTITFDSEGKITNVQEITSVLTETKVNKEQDEKKIYNDAELKITIKKEEESNKQKLKILKMDKDDENKKLAGVIYKVKQKTETSVKTLKQATDTFGEIEIDLINSDKIELKIKELQSIKGYVLNNTEKTIILVKNKNTGLMEVEKNSTDENVDYEIDNNGVITIKEKNESKVSEELEAKANICFFLTKKDQKGNLLGGVEFSLIETTTGRSYELKTDENGNVELHDFKVPEEGTYEFYITEKNTTTGYDIATSPIKLIISYEEYNGEMKTSQIVVARGYKYIEYKRCDEYETSDTYQLDVQMTLINAASGSGDMAIEMGMNVEKVDKLTKMSVKDAKYDVTVLYSNGTSINATKEAENIGSVLNDITIPNGESVTIKFKEIEAPIGYKLDETERTVVVKNENGVLKVKQNNVKSAHIKDNEILEIILEDELKENGGILRYESDDPGYTLNIINNNKYSSSLVLEASVFNLKVEKGNTVEYNAYSGLGRSPRYKNTVQFKEIKIDGDQKLIIKQTTAPLHHIINENIYTLNIQRDASNEIIQLINTGNPNLNAIVNNQEKTITVTIENEPSELMVAINKIDSEDSSIGLANVGFTMCKYNDNTSADLRTYAYIKTRENGTGYNTISTYVTKGTALYEINEVNPPIGYYKNGAIGLYITVDKNGNISSASTVENSELFDKGKCKVEQISGKYIELTIKNIRKPEPTYSLIINNKNKYDDLIKVEGSVFNVQINQSNGARINKDITTDGSGIARIDNLNGKGTINIRIEQTSAGQYYKRDTEIKTIELSRSVVQTVSEQGNVFAKRLVMNSKTPDNLNVYVDNQNQTITVEILNERTFGLEIVKVDIEDNEIYLQGAKFEVYQGTTKIGETTTDGYGRGYIYMGDAPRKQTVEYTLKEVEAPKGYSLIGDWKLKVLFNQAGEIENLQLDGENISKEPYTNGYMSVKITEPKIRINGGSSGTSQSETYTKLKIIKENYQNQKLNIEKVVFDIYTEAEDGRTIRAVKTTNANGEIELNGIPGNEITIKLKELETSNGYVLDDQERTIVVKKVKVENQERLKLVEEKTSKDLNVKVDEDARLIEVNIPNKISEDYFGLAIVKEDSEDELLTIEDAKYEIKDEETGEIYSLTTGSKGIGMLFIAPKTKAGTYIYKMKEVEAPKGYQLCEEEIDLEVTFEIDAAGNPYIKTANIKTGEEVSEIQNQTTNYVEVHIKNKAEENDISSYDLKIEKVDRDDIDIKLPGAVLQIDVNNAIGQTGLSKTDVTDSEGKILINNIKGAGNIEINITEIQPPAGRKFDSKQKCAKLTKDEKTGRLKLIESLNVDTIIDNKKRLITILVRNEIGDGKYTLVVEKRDNTNKKISLSNVKMKIKIPGEQEEREVETDKDGRIVLTDLIMPKDGRYTYKITEIETINGYKKLEVPIEFKTKFENNGDIEEITKVEITKGKNAEVLEVLPKYMRIAVYNESEETENSYKVTVVKKDSQEKDIPIAKTKIKLSIEYENGERKTIEDVTDENGKISIDNLTEKGIAKITVAEKEAVQGYDLDTREKIVKCNIKTSQDISVEEKDEELQVNVKENEIEIEMTNDRSDEYINLHLEKFISKVNDEEKDRAPEVEAKEGKFLYNKNAEKEVVKYGDKVEFTIRIYNEGTNSGYAKTIRENIPEGLEYIEDDEINKANQWNKVEDKLYETNILSKENGEANIIEAYDEEKGISYKEVKIVLKVVEKNNNESLSENIAVVKEIEDEKGTSETEEGVYKKDNENKEQFEVEYVKMEVRKEISKMTLIIDGERKDQKVNANGVSKIEIYRKQVDKAEVEVEYKITVTNTGTKTGKIESIKDYIPEGMELVEGKNEGWTKDGSYIVNEEINAGESITKTIILKCKGNNMGIKKNVAEVSAKENIEQESKSEEATVIISVSTGRLPVYVTLIISTLVILGVGTYLIKKKILQ